MKSPSDSSPADVSPDTSGFLVPLGTHDVAIDTVGYWGHWQEVNHSAIIDHCEYWMRHEGWIGNFEAAAANELPAKRRGREFTDADVYKLIEAMSWEQGRKPTPDREQQIQELISIVGAAQESDGYINTNFGRPGQAPRYSDMQWGHELYNYGHLLQAAVARARTAGRDDLFEVACKVADHICAVFGENGRNAICGHPGVELGLIAFARLTGDERYRRQAELFLERRGHGILGAIEFGPEYFQDDLPIADATVLRGHAVRALYLTAAAVDMATDRKDLALLDTLELQWGNTVRARTYLTGGMGSHHQDEAFGANFELPPDRAYCETCAGVGLFMLSWRLLLATGRVRYADMMERVLFNVIATSPAEDGRSFFYTNTLHQRTEGHVPASDERSLRAASSLRAPWFEVSCCPPNVARTFATLDAHIAAVDRDGITVAMYTASTISTALPDGTPLSLQVRTKYPQLGNVAIEIEGSSPRSWDLRLRIPNWAEGATVQRGGAKPYSVGPGWIILGGVGQTSETIELVFPFEPRFTYADPRIDAARSAVAVERGPLLYCVESHDLMRGSHVDQLVVDTSTGPRIFEGSVSIAGRLEDVCDRKWPYTDAPPRSMSASQTLAVDVQLVPYNSWGRRGPSSMRVWMRTT